MFPQAEEFEVWLEAMYQPQNYCIVLTFMIGSMVCWGSWANTVKLTPGFPFQLLYWDYVIGMVVGSLVWAFTLGSLHGGDLAFLPNLTNASRSSIALAFAAGMIFNIANLLLVAAIEVAGLSVAFPIGIGLALVVGVALNYLVAPAGNPVLLVAGVGFVVAAIVLDALAYKRREAGPRRVSNTGIRLSLACGILMGLFYPLVAKAVSGPSHLGPYSVVFVFSLGVAACALPVNTFLMRRPFTSSAPVTFRQYGVARPSWHIWGMLGGVVWCTGLVLSVVASQTHIVGPAISYAIGQGATMVSAIWGVFIWKEFASAPSSARRLLPIMFGCFLLGLGAVALAPILRR